MTRFVPLTRMNTLKTPATIMLGMILFMVGLVFTSLLVVGCKVVDIFKIK